MLWTMKRVCLMCAVAVFTLVSMAVSADANENGTAEGVPTFNADVAPILYENCAVCHRAGQVAPMTLTSYAEVRPWARAIKGKVTSREMPPWFADPRYGNFQDVPTLSQAEIDTIAAWADGGAPQGAGPAPDAPVFVSEWGHDRHPDFVIDQPELHLPAQGELAYVKLWLDNPWKEDVYLEAVQMRPGNPGVVHHTGVFSSALPPGTKIGEKPLYPGGQLIPQPVPVDANESTEARVARAETVANGNDGLDSQLVFYTPGRGFNKYPEGTAKRVHADRYIMFNSHYTLTGRPEVDNSKAGFWFSKEQPHHQVLTVSSGSGGGTGPVRIVEGTEQLVTDQEGRGLTTMPVIPPHVEDFRVTGIWPVTDDVTIYGVWPHMHFPRQRHDVHDQLSRRHRGDDAERAGLRLQLAAGVRLRGADQGAGGQYDQDGRPLRQQHQEPVQPRAGQRGVPHPVLWTQVNATPPGVARAPRGPRSACDTRASRAARSCCTAPRTRSLRRVPP